MKRLLLVSALIGGCNASALTKPFEIPQFTPAGIQNLSAKASDNTITVSYQAQLAHDGLPGRVSIQEDGTTIKVLNYLQVKDAAQARAQADYETVVVTFANMPKGDYTVRVVGADKQEEQTVSIANDTTQKRQLKLDVTPIAQSVAFSHASASNLQRTTVVTDGTGVAFLKLP